MRTRETRQPVRLRARMRTGQTWSDVTIRNVSSRGMLLSCDTPPPKGSYLEICGPATTLVGRAMWVSDNEFGVRVQDPIDVPSAARGGKWRRADPETLQARNARATVAVARSATASRSAGRLGEYSAIAIAVALAAMAAGYAVSAALGDPMRTIQRSLAGTR